MKTHSLTFIVAIILAIFNLFYFTGCSGKQTIEIFPAENPASSRITQIYIGGSVNNPGYYALEDRDTIDSLIKAAGGTADNYDSSQFELIVIQPNEATQKIDINRADAWLLKALPGVGETKAQAIIEYRTENGLFRNINELLNVEGIGQGVFNSIKDLITVCD